MSTVNFPVRLMDGEKILWSGRPVRGLLFSGVDWFLIPFSMMWCGFAVFWEATVLRAPAAPVFFALWGIPFVLAGLYFTVGRFVVDAWLRRNTSYALTNRRILIVRGRPFPKLTSLSLQRMPDLQLTEWADGRGTIRFGPGMPFLGSAGWGGWSPSADPTPQFIGIDDAQPVFDRIQRAASAA